MRMLVFAVSLFCCSAAMAGEGAGALAGPDMRQAFAGRTIDWYEDGGWHAGNLTLLPDGRAEITLESPRPAHDVGRWSITGDKLCTVWARLRESREKCYSVTPDGPGRFVTSGGDVFILRAAGV